MEGSSLKISACYIVKNEEVNLEKSLNSIKNKVDELIVVDTGSTDNTVGIAKKFNAKIFCIPWKNDFSEARNVAIAQATGEWILFLDADEYFSDNPSVDLHEVILSLQPADVMLVSMDNIDADSRENLLTFYAPRIFRNVEGLCYEGRIHEELRYRGKQVEKIVYVPEEQLKIVHTGYSVSISHEKAERNLQLLLYELENTEKPDVLYPYLAEVYAALDNAEKAKYYAEQDIKNGRRRITFASKSWRILLDYAVKENDKRKRREIAASAVFNFPEIPEFHAELAESLAADYIYTDAIREAEKAEKLFHNYDDIEPMQFTTDMLIMLKKRLNDWKVLQKNSEKLYITACVIVRNEEKNIAAWLANTQQYADQQVVVDTGSKDKTVEIVKKSKAYIYDFNWQNDFSQAKNYALSKAKGNWVFFLDADETFANPQQLRGYLAGIEKYKKNIDAIMVPIINIDTDMNNQEISRFLNVRIFRNLPGIHYEGYVHERLVMAEGKPLQLYKEEHDLQIIHTGYSSHIIAGKVERNWKILQDDIEKNGEQPVHYRYLADCYYARGNMEQALKYAILALGSTVQAVDSASDMFDIALTCVEKMDCKVAECLALAKKAQALFPKKAAYFIKAGHYLFSVGKTDDAAKEFGKALVCLRENNNNTGDTYTSIAEQSLLYQDMALIYHQKREWEKAALCLQKAKQFSSLDDGIIRMILNSNKEKNIAEQVKALQSYMGNETINQHYIAQWLEEKGFLKHWQIFTGENKQEYVLAQNEDLIVLYKKIEQDMANNIVGLCRILIKLHQERDSLIKGVQIANLSQALPEAMYAVWECWQKYEPVNDFHWDGYKVWLRQMIVWGSAEQLQDFVELAAGLSDSCLWEMAEELFQGEKWLIAWNVYSRIPAASKYVKGKFWCHAGICQFSLGNNEIAGECFANATAYDDTDEECRSYITWNERRLKNDA